MAMSLPSRSLVVRWLVVLAFSVALGLGLSAIHMPAAWILAGILSAGTLALCTGRELILAPKMLNAGRGTIGILAGVPLLNSDTSKLVHFLLPGAFAAIVTLIICLAGGYLLAHTHPSISAETGILSMLAGGASIMPGLAADLQADYRYVALSQYLRLLAVSLSLPVLSHFYGIQAPTSAEDGGSQPWWVVLLIIAVAIVGTLWGRVARIPAPAVFGPMITIVVVGLPLPGHIDLTPPRWLAVIAFLIIGWMCGGSLSLSALRQFARLLPATLLFIAILLAGCAATAYPLHLWLDIDYFAAYLATSPGALETVIALSSGTAALDAIIAVQLIRLAAVLIIAAYLPHLLHWYRRYRQ